MSGRDVTDNAPGDGKVGFSFSAVGSYAITECVKDDMTGLIWAGKSNNGNLHDVSKTFTNYDDATKPQIYTGLAFTNIASAYSNPTQTQINSITNTVGYIAAVNAQTHCGYSDWRLPTSSELQSIVDYSGSSSAIDINWFPNSIAAKYWTSSAYGTFTSAYTWFVDFTDGLIYADKRTNSQAVRLVRGTPANTTGRYQVIENGAEVLDTQTDLIWRRCAEGRSWSGTTCIGTPHYADS